MHQSLLEGPGASSSNLGGALRLANLPKDELTEFFPSSSSLGESPAAEPCSGNDGWYHSVGDPIMLQLVHCANELVVMTQSTAAEVYNMQKYMCELKDDISMVRNVESSHHSRLVAHVGNLKDDIYETELLISSLDLSSSSAPSSYDDTVIRDMVEQAKVQVGDHINTKFEQ